MANSRARIEKGPTMHLLAHLIARIAAIVLLCLLCTAGWVMFDAHRTIVAETTASAERVRDHLAGVFWNRLLWRDGMRKESVLPPPEWRTLETLNAVAPGICITFAIPGDDPYQLCSKVDMVATPAPSWFRALHDLAWDPYPQVRRVLSRKDANPVALYAGVDSDAAVRLAWQRVAIVVGVSAVMAAAIALLVSLAIGHALLPARAIVAGLRRLQEGDQAWRLPRFRTIEFDCIAGAVNDLARQLARTTADRIALTNRLFQVQEDERRAIARDLHDEFGQCLTATSAIATLIETNAASERPDIAADARTIVRTQSRMMTALRGTLTRLRTQNIEEIGLEASLRELIAERNAQSASPARFKFEATGGLAGLPPHIAIGVYRFAQECLTNAARHGTPNVVNLSVARTTGSRDVIAVSVEDDGGGNVRDIEKNSGLGLLGMRERVDALGGTIAFCNVRNGVRVAAAIPILTCRNLAEMAA